MVQQESGAVLRSEVPLLRGLHFDLIVHSPLRPLDGFFRDLERCRDAAPTAAPSAASNGSGAAAGGAAGNGSGNGRSGGAAGGAASDSQGRAVGASAGAGDGGAGGAAPLDEALLRLSDEQLARARGAAAAAADALLLTDAALLFPPGQLALAAMRAGFRKARSKP